MWKASLPAPIARFVAPHVGAVVEVSDLSHPGGNAVTFRVRGRARTAIVKAYRSDRTFRQELHAYRAWAPRLPDTPTLLGHRSEPPRALLLSALPGVPLASAAPSVEDERTLHARAGSWLRALHGLSFRDLDPVPVGEAYRRRILAWEAAASEGVEAALAGWIAERLHDVPARLRGAARVPCHLDFEPCNWLVERGGGWVGVIDFEHARPDLALADLARLAAYGWPARPDLAKAFLSAYGGPSGDADMEAADLETVDRLAVFEAGRRLAWAVRHGDTDLASSARAALAARGAPAGS